MAYHILSGSVGRKRGRDPESVPDPDVAEPPLAKRMARLSVDGAGGPPEPAVDVSGWAAGMKAPAAWPPPPAAGWGRATVSPPAQPRVVEPDTAWPHMVGVGGGGGSSTYRSSRAFESQATPPLLRQSSGSSGGGSLWGDGDDSDHGGQLVPHAAAATTYHHGAVTAYPSHGVIIEELPDDEGERGGADRDGAGAGAGSGSGLHGNPLLQFTDKELQARVASAARPQAGVGSAFFMDAMGRGDGGAHLALIPYQPPLDVTLRARGGGRGQGGPDWHAAAGAAGSPGTLQHDTSGDGVAADAWEDDDAAMGDAHASTAAELGIGSGSAGIGDWESDPGYGAPLRDWSGVGGWAPAAYAPPMAHPPRPLTLGIMGGLPSAGVPPPVVAARFPPAPASTPNAADSPFAYGAGTAPFGFHPPSVPRPPSLVPVWPPAAAAVAAADDDL